MKRIISGMRDWVSLTLMVEKRFQKRTSPLQVIINHAPKHWEQLGYFHAEVLPKLTLALFEAGEIKRNVERLAKYWLKVKKGYGVWIEYNGSMVFDPDSFSDADVETMSHIIDFAIDECEKRSITVNPPRGKNGIN